MSNLEQLYREREQLNARIAEEERRQQLEAMLPVVEEAAWKNLPAEALAGKVVAALEYTDGTLSRIAITLKVDIIDGCEVIKEIAPVAEEPTEEYEAEDDEDDDSSDIHRSPSIGFTVQFADGTVINEKNAKHTWIEALCHMGLERVAQYKGTVKGYPIIGKRFREVTGKGKGKLQHLVDGWWIYINLSNSQKIQHLNNISRMLNIPLQIHPKLLPTT